MQTASFTDLEIDECPSGCHNCPQVWVNHQIEHRIVCYCTKCKHSGKLPTQKDKPEVENDDSK